MIKIKVAAEPLDFDENVRQKGVRFLAENGLPQKSEDWKRHEYWRCCADSLYQRYSGVCAYLCCEIPRQAMTVDHGLPKTAYQKLAYEWKNLLPCTSGVNAKKQAKVILYPFDKRFKKSSFVLDLMTGAIAPNPAYSRRYQALCQEAIDVLGLDMEDNRRMRRGELEEYEIGVPAQLIKRKYPFVYSEIKRQRWPRHPRRVYDTCAQLLQSIKAMH